MCEIATKAGCLHCHSPKVIKNATKAGGPQRFLCKSCRKQIIGIYHNKRAHLPVKYLITSILTRNCGVRDRDQQD